MRNLTVSGRIRCYLASVMDLYSQKIVGYSFSTSLTTDQVMDALANAYNTQNPKEGLILQTDLRNAITSDTFVADVRSLGIEQSFSRRGCSYDNACIESFHAILKKEEVNHVQYLDYPSATLTMFQFIEGWYNRKRKNKKVASIKRNP